MFIISFVTLIGKDFRRRTNDIVRNQVSLGHQMILTKKKRGRKGEKKRKKTIFNDALAPGASLFGVAWFGIGLAEMRCGLCYSGEGVALLLSPSRR